MEKSERTQMHMQSTMTPSGLTSGADLIGSAKASWQRDFLAMLTPEQLVTLPYLFDFWAMPHQIAPSGDWRTWVILGGRGAGKTRAGAEWVRRMVEGALPHAPGAARRVALVGETMDQAREVMVFGDSGILSVCPPDRRPEWIAGRRMLVWPNGAEAQVFSAHDPDSLRGPQFDAVWADAIGCPAIDKGANQPGHMLDPRSGDASDPYYSNGNRDDLMQAQYLAAVYDYFGDTQNNPASAQYDGRMVDTNRMHVWGWDTRPYPFWPGNTAPWSDGADYARGHWLNGRATNRTLASVVAEICERSGAVHYDVAALFGVVRGYGISDASTGRAALQPLMLTYGFDAIERDGQLVFRNRDGWIDHDLGEDTLARDPETDQSLSLTRAAAAEITGRVQLGYLHADGDYDAIAAEVVLPDEVSLAATRDEVPLVMTRGEGQATVARWLQEARIGRDMASFALPPSHVNVGAGDVVSLRSDTHKGTYRVDRVEEAGLRLITATRIEPEVYRAQPMRDDAPALKPFTGPIPAEMLFLDLPLLTGDEQPHSPYIAASGRPWPGSIALYGAPQDSDYVLQKILSEAATIGVTQSPLQRGPVGTWDRQSALEVSLVSGTLSSATYDALLAGANTLAIGNGGADHWEIMQFKNATPLFERGYALTGFLRGQAGSAGLMPDMWPTGSRVVLMNAVPEQVLIPTASRGNDRHYRFGPAKQPITDPSYRYVSHAFAGNGLRPYPVVHLRAAEQGGDVAVSWIRSTRIDGGIWADGEVPLGEDSEAYLVRVSQGGVVQREETVTNPGWTYSAADIASDVGSGAYVVEVAQLSDRFGAGPFVGLDL